MRILCALLLLGVSATAATKKFDLLVQGAADSELQPLLKALEHKRQINLGAWSFWTGNIGKKSVVVSRTEMGPLNATLSTRAIRDMPGPGPQRRRFHRRLGQGNPPDGRRSKTRQKTHQHAMDLSGEGHTRAASCRL